MAKAGSLQHVMVRRGQEGGSVITAPRDAKMSEQAPLEIMAARTSKKARRHGSQQLAPAFALPHGKSRLLGLHHGDVLSTQPCHRSITQCEDE